MAFLADDSTLNIAYQFCKANQSAMRRVMTWWQLRIFPSWLWPQTLTTETCIMSLCLLSRWIIRGSDGVFHCGQDIQTYNLTDGLCYLASSKDHAWNTTFVLLNWHGFSSTCSHSDSWAQTQLDTASEYGATHRTMVWQLPLLSHLLQRMQMYQGSMIS